MATAFLETFETDGNTLNGGDRYTTSIAEFLTGSNRAQNNQVFTRSDDAGLDNIRGNFTNTDGTWFAVSDFDGNGNNAATATMEFTGIDISGLTDLSFSGSFAEFNPTNGRNHWDADTQVFFEVSIDGGAYTKIMQFASDRANGNNRPVEIDMDLNGVGDGARLTRDFASFSSDIIGTGSTLDLRVTFENLNQNNEDFQMDNLSITGTETGPNATDDSFTIGENELAFGDLLANDSDPQNDALTIQTGAGGAVLTPITVLSADGREGSAFFGPSGDLTFAFDTLGNFDDLAAGETDTVTLEYAISDGNGGTDTADVTVVIQGEDAALAGDELDNMLNGTDGNDVLIGNAGNDTLRGGDGEDSMDGGEGDDIFYVNSAGDTVIEAAGEGYDRVNTSITYTLTENVEMGTVTGTADLDLTGNVEDNWLNGNGGANVLSGLGGNDRLQGRGGDDVLNGGQGNDNLYGNAGTDTFVFTDGDGIDVIRDFESGETIDLSATSAGSFADLVLTDVSSGAMVDYGAGLVILSGMTIAELGADDFQF
ncbi:MAG: Ig-like domain-containing protein [Pseudomonadota bacterium]